ncbi:MAG TPA: hypothetical protein VFU81_16080 [Thermomicrobiales bacterium]|nr:hypothetical protein [Thermomicrobiales bacterium]
MRSPRILGAFLVLALLAAVAWPLVGAARPASQAATPMAAGTPVAAGAPDLAALALTPADAAAAGLAGYGVVRGDDLSLADAAGLYAAARHGEPAQVQASLAAAGFREAYRSELGLPLQPGNERTHIKALVETDLAAFATPDGAASAFPLFSRAVVGGSKDNAAATPQSDAESRLLAIRHGASIDGKNFGGYALSFRVGGILARITIGNVNSAVTTSDVLDALRAQLEPRLQAASAAPGLSHLALRLAGADVTTVDDGYGRLAGKTLPSYDDTTARLADREFRYGDATDVYGVLQSIRAGRGRNDTRYLTDIYRLPNADAASAWMRNVADRAKRAPNVASIAPIAGAPSFGDESAALALTIDRNDKTVGHGVAIFARVGADIAQIEITGPGDVPLGSVAALASAQVGCVQAGACPTRVPPPAGLPLPVPAVTPAAATPAAATPALATPAA